MADGRDGRRKRDGAEGIRPSDVADVDGRLLALARLIGRAAAREADRVADRGKDPDDE